MVRLFGDRNSLDGSDRDHQFCWRGGSRSDFILVWLMDSFLFRIDNGFVGLNSHLYEAFKKRLPEYF